MALAGPMASTDTPRPPGIDRHCRERSSPGPGPCPEQAGAFAVLALSSPIVVAATVSEGIAR